MLLLKEAFAINRYISLHPEHLKASKKRFLHYAVSTDCYSLQHFQPN